MPALTFQMGFRASCCMGRPHLLSSCYNVFHQSSEKAFQPLRVLQSTPVGLGRARRFICPWLGEVCEASCLHGVQEIGQQLEAAALATRMAMEADTNTGMEDSAAPGTTAQQAPGKPAEKESKQVLPCGRPAHPDTHMHDVLCQCASSWKGTLVQPAGCICGASHPCLCFGGSKACS